MLREFAFLEAQKREHKRCFQCAEASVEVDHPFVPVVSDFAVAAFNELCRMVGFYVHSLYFYDYCLFTH